MQDYKNIERSIITKFRKSIYSKFVNAIETYHLIDEHDKIMVCISGGKDSFLLAKCIQEYKNHGKIPFDVCFVCMDPGYSKENRNYIERNAEFMNIPLEIIDSDVFEVMEKEKASCSLCARMRRGFLYRIALEKGCNKLALGHHFDDVIETTLLSMFYGSEIKTMVPKRKSRSHLNLEVIRPLYMVKEKDILKWCDCNELTFIDCACSITRKEKDSKRQEMKVLIAKLKEINLRIDENIFISMHNVNLDSINGYTKDGKKYTLM